jgi:serine/threonine-protein kinase
MALQRRYPEAIEAYRRITRLDPTGYKAYTSMGRCHALAGQYPEALAMLQKGRGLTGDVPSILAAMAQVYALAGDEKRARGLLAELVELSNAKYVPGTCFAIVHMGLGEMDRALDWLDRACAHRDLPLSALKTHPLYDPLRGEKRFQALLKRMRLA